MESGTGVTDEQCGSDEMPGLRGGRELMTRQLAKLLGTSQSSPRDRTREVPAKVNSYHGGEPNGIATPRQVGARNDKSAWCWMKETATKSRRRDLQMRVSSLFYGFMATVTEATPDLSCCLVSAAGHGSPSLRGIIVPKQSGRGMRLPRPFSGARNDRSAGGFAPEPESGGEMGVTSRTTISAHGAFSIGRVPVGRGR
jgi:hypothetical protein